MHDGHHPADRLLGRLNRRRVAAGLAGLGAAALLPRSGQAQTAGALLIDVHHHFFPPPYLAAAHQWDLAHGRTRPRNIDWTPQRSLDEMNRNNVGTAFLSIPSTPGPWWGVKGDAMAKLARTCNDYAAGMAKDHPGRFGFFASLPMPDIDASLKEIAYAFDTLKADGIGLQTDFGDTWPGNPAYEPIWNELSRRKAIVYFHPLAPNCCMGLVKGVRDGNLEYPTDTGRAALSLLLNGVFARHRDIAWIFSHAGGPIPMLAGRWNMGNRDNPHVKEFAPDGIIAELQRLYYEIANSAYPPTLAALTRFAPTDHILFGTDYPYYSTAPNAAGLVAFGLPRADLAAIQHGNAERLFPRLRA